MNRTGIINTLIKHNNYKKYLEIGVKKGRNFNKVEVFSKEGVDPAGNCDYKMTSDDFFKSDRGKYDIIFIDGLHLKDQVLRDVKNSLEHLSDNGIIVMHDCNPPDKECAAERPLKKDWNGTTWEAFAELRMTREDLFMCTVDTDQGCGIIKRGKQDLFPLSKINYTFLENNRAKLLNLISEQQFLDMIGKIL